MLKSQQRTASSRVRYLCTFERYRNLIRDEVYVFFSTLINAFYVIASSFDIVVRHKAPIIETIDDSSIVTYNWMDWRRTRAEVFYRKGVSSGDENIDISTLAVITFAAVLKAEWFTVGSVERNH